MMSFRCPQCQTPDTLEILQVMELPPDNRCDEIALQVVGCRDCTFRALAVYEELLSAAERETWEHIGYWVSPDAVESVSAAISSCPNPFDAYCHCPAHTSLGQKDVYGIWRGLLEMERGHTFAMRIYHQSAEPHLPPANPSRSA